MYPVAGDPYAQWLAQGGAAAVGPVSGMAGLFRDWVSQPRDFSMEAMLSGPRGPLVDWARSQHPMTQAALVTAPIPVVGDLAGLAADARMYASEPESRTLGNAGLSMLGLLPFVPGMTAFHGTPHRFAPEPDAPLGKFRLDKIGTGEGAQAYGHGIYLAESPDVAGSYKAVLGGDEEIYRVGLRETNLSDWSPQEQLALKAQAEPDVYVGHSKQAFLANLEDQGASEPALREMSEAWDRVAAEGKASVERIQRGSLYTVDLPDEQIEKMLDWDKPLIDQSPEVKAIIRDAVPTGAYEKLLMQRTGDSVHALGQYLGGAPKASEYLRASGIPGLKYFDGASRKAGDGTRNFVLFDPEIAKIIDRK